MCPNEFPGIDVLCHHGYLKLKMPDAGRRSQRLEANLRRLKVSVMDRREGVMVELLRSYRLKEVRAISATPLSNGVSSVAGLVALKRLLSGSDVVIGGYGYEEQREVARAASELGMPFITYPVVTTILPDGIPFDELVFPAGSYPPSPVLGLIARSFQMIALLRLVSGVAEPLLAPQALTLYLDPDSLDLRVEIVELELELNRERNNVD